MPAFETFRDLTGLAARVDGLLAAATAADGRPALSDQLRLDLDHGGRRGGRAALAVDDASDDTVGAPLAYAQSSPGNATDVVQLVVHPDRRDDLVALGRPLLEHVTRSDPHDHDDPGRPGPDPAQVTWWVAEPGAEHERLATELGWSAHRQLLQMRRPLPTGEPVHIDVRPFRPDQDADAWLHVNNRAFADHGEQGGWDRATLEQRMAEPWFDPAGFLVHEVDGRMAGFCWTKLHPDADPVEGEIYVIAVDPDFGGRGLGRALTLAGLASIADRGVTVGMLYVDADNTAAVTLYRRLGFVVHRTDVAFTGPPPAPSRDSAPAATTGGAP